MPGLAPLPPQSAQATGRLDGHRHLRAGHRLVEREVDLDLDVGAAGGADRLAAGRAAARAPRPRKIDEKMSAKSPNPSPAPPPPAGPPPGGRRPPKASCASYSWRFSGSDRTSWAWEISLKRSSAFGSSGLASGWCTRASLRYAFLISSALAVRETPSVA